MAKRVIGLTGGVGAGKSTAAAIMGQLGAVVVDCDQLGRDVVAVGGAAYQPLVDHFGPGIVTPSGEIDRPALGAIVFNNADQLATLNAITHPAIDAEIAQAIAAAPPDTVVVLDMAVLVESDLGAGQYQEVVVVEAPSETRVERLSTHRGMEPADARARIASQVSDAERRAVADVVITNDGDVDALRRQVETWWLTVQV